MESQVQTPRLSTENPNPTTFVQADTSSFKKVVQMLTGSPETISNSTHQPKPVPGPKKQSFKLYERRNSLRNFNLINPLISTSSNFHSFSGLSPRGSRSTSEVLSPSILDFPSLLLSPDTTLCHDINLVTEEKAIAEKGFYLHPSPRADAVKPKLLPLFPESSPSSN